MKGGEIEIEGEREDRAAAEQGPGVVSRTAASGVTLRRSACARAVSVKTRNFYQSNLPLLPIIRESVDRMMYFGSLI